jgi:restriction endonuclease S subunit
MNQNLKLSDIASIRSGMAVSKTSNNDEELLTNISVRMIGTSDYNEAGILRNDLEPNVLYKPTVAKNFLKENEILFNAKGRRFFASIFKQEYENVIASAAFLVITIKSSAVYPEYLTCFLNHPETLKIFDSKLSTQVMPSVTKQELGNIEVIIPNFEIQSTIVATEDLKNKFVFLEKELISLKEIYINALIYKKLKR